MMAIIESGHVCPNHLASLNANEKSALRAVKPAHTRDGHVQGAFEHRCHHLLGSYRLFGSSGTLPRHRTSLCHTI